MSKNSKPIEYANDIPLDVKELIKWAENEIKEYQKFIIDLKKRYEKR